MNFIQCGYGTNYFRADGKPNLRRKRGESVPTFNSEGTARNFTNLILFFKQFCYAKKKTGRKRELSIYSGNLLKERKRISCLTKLTSKKASIKIC